MWRSTAVLAFILAVSPAAAQGPPAVEALVAVAITPGSTALLVEHPTAALAQTQLAERLKHPGADVRAAAARVILAIGARGLLPRLTAALQTERSSDTAAELTRAIAILGGPGEDEALVASWAQLSAEAAPAAIAFARVRGGVALGALPQLAALQPRALAAFVEAARPDAVAIDRLLDGAVADKDVTVFRAALSASRALRLSPNDARLVAGLAVDRPPVMRLEAARAALTWWTGEATIAPSLVAALNLDASLGGDDGTIDAVVIRELAARLAGRRGPQGDAWRAQIKEPGVLLAGLLVSKGVQELLSSAELRQVRRALPEGRRQGPPAEMPPAPASLAVQLLDSYPRGFVPAVIAATGCDLAKARGQGLGAGAGELVLRRDGRPARVAPLDTGATDAGCIHATRVLLLTHVSDQPPTVEGERRIAVLPFDDEYLTCRESEADDFSTVPTTGPARVEPPKKVRHVNPVYPATAQSAGVQGAVVLEATIGTSGCVGRLRVVRGVDPRLDLSALLAVMRWRFSPTRIDGRPTPVTLTATVGFSLR